MRADAQRNRALIVTTAVDLFAAHGPGVSMEEIARAAGLGVGTLYRHFPDRRALLEEIGVDTLRRLLSAVRASAARAQPSWDVLLQIVEDSAGLPLALVKSMLGKPDDDRSDAAELMNTVDALLEELAEEAQREGSMRPDITPREVVDLLSVAMCRPGARADDALTTVILDGLRASPVVSAPVRHQG